MTRNVNMDWAVRIFGDLTVVELLIWIAAAVAACILAYKLWPRIKAGVRLIEALGALPAFIEDSNSAAKARAERLEGIESSIAAIRHEVLPNGGSSLKDSQLRMEATVADLVKSVEHVKRQGAAAKTTLARNSRLLNDHLKSTDKETNP